MKVRTSAMRGFALMALSAFTFAACDDKTPTTVTPEPDVVVTVVPESATLQVGQTQGFLAQVSNATNVSVTWSSTNQSVATVSATGVVTAVAPGTALIQATSVEDPTKFDAAFVTVVAGGDDITVELIPAAASVEVGGTVQLISVVGGTTNEAVTYTSSSPAIATVDQNTGLVTGVAVGTAVITGRSAANPNEFDTSVITVVAEAPEDPVTVTVTPSAATAQVGGTQVFVATVGNTDNDAVTWTSSDETVATVDATGRATAVGTGTAVITATSVADPTKSAQATFTVVAQTPPPSISIQNVTGLGAGRTATGEIGVTVNVAADLSHDVRAVEVRLGGETVCRQTFAQPLGTTQGVATINCDINTAELDENGLPRFPNGAYELTAVAVNGAGTVVAEASFGDINLTNENVVSGVVTFDNTLDDADNDPDAPTEVSSGRVWHGGSAMVTLTPAIFEGTAISEVDVAVVRDCEVAFDETFVVAEQTVEIGDDGTGSVTFSEDDDDDEHIDDLSNRDVCFIVRNARDANGAIVTLADDGGRGNVITEGGDADVTAAGANQNEFAVDNVQPEFEAGALTLDPAAFDGLTTEAYLGIGGSFDNTGGNANVLNGEAEDPFAGDDPPYGVGGVTYTFYAVPIADFDAGDLEESVAAGTAFETADELATTETAGEYVLVIEAKDALGNVEYKGDDANLVFGVDLDAPTIELVTAESPAQNAINPVDLTIRYAVEDEGSGSEGITGSTQGHSVFETDTDTGTEIRCYDFAGALVNCNTNPQSTSMPVATDGATEFYEATIPGDENFYVITVQAIDAAGNVSETTITRQALQDFTAGPNSAIDAVTINNYTIDNENNTATVNGVVRDNIELDFYDARFEFDALTSSDAVVLPVQVPFSLPEEVGDYGLPLEAVATASETTEVNIDGIVTDPSAVVPAFDPQNFGFSLTDLAGNYAFSGVALPVGADFDGFPDQNFMSFELDASTGATADQSDNDVITLTASAETDPADANPLGDGGRVYYYYVHPVGGQLVLIGSVAGASATRLTGETIREYRYPAVSVSSDDLMVNETYTFVAIGVASDGDGVITQAVDVNIVP